MAWEKWRGICKGREEILERLQPQTLNACAQAREMRDSARKEKGECIVELKRIRGEMEAIKQNILDVSDGDQDSK